MNPVLEHKIRAMIQEVIDIILENKSDFRTPAETKEAIKKSRNLPDEYKDVSIKFLKQYSKYNSDGRISGLSLHPDLIKKIKEKGLPDGFDMGVDKNGFYIHTHRARSKSHEKPDGVTEKEIKFVDSTG